MDFGILNSIARVAYKDTYMDSLDAEHIDGCILSENFDNNDYYEIIAYSFACLRAL
jgi:hypothetical protein